MTTEEIWLQFNAVPNRPDTYRATVRRSGSLARGTTSRDEQSFERSSIGVLRERYETFLNQAHGIPGMSGAPDPQGLIALGQQIATLLPQPVYRSIGEALARVRREGRRLRIIIDIAPDALDLLDIPWELLVVSAESGVANSAIDLLAGDPQVAVIRQVRSYGRRPLMKLNRPLVTQGFIAVPQDQLPIQAPETLKVFHELQSEGQITGNWYGDDVPILDTVNVLRERLRIYQPQIVHLICHGSEFSVSVGRQRMDLLLVHTDGLTRRIGAYELAPILRLSLRLQIVVLHACLSSRFAGDASSDAERRAIQHIALELVRQCVPVVIAMQGEVRQDAADVFASEFYRSLADGEDVAWAVQAGRVAIWSKEHWIDWSLPVMYQGSARLEQSGWHTRLADRIEVTIDRGRGARAATAALAIALLMIGIARLLLAPGTPLDLEGVMRVLFGWALLGLCLPAAVAGAMAEARREAQDTTQYARALRAQWSGAYLGYSLGSLIGTLPSIVVWGVTGGQQLPHLAELILFILAPTVGVLGCYTIARQQVRSALSMGNERPDLFSTNIALLLVGAALTITAIPQGLLLLHYPLFSWLSNPGWGAMMTGLALMLAVITLGNT